MKTYIIGYYSLFDGELKLEKVQAESELVALKNYLEWCDDLPDSVDEIKDYCINCDSNIEIVEI